MRLLLIDDHVMFRQGLKFLLSDLDESLQFMESGSCEKAVDLLADDTCDLILLDLNMPGIKGLGALRMILAAAPQVPVAVLSGETGSDLIRAAIDEGASGFVPKASSSELLVAALQLILAGGVYLPEDVLGESVTERSTAGDKQLDLLSQRQTDVLLRAIKGQPNKVIAIDMGIAEGTVKTHLSAAFKILGVHNRTEAVFAAARLGLTPENAAD
jgi:DNA-binding NarL/FixJ family response regulator